MRVERFQVVPPQAREIRQKVFVEEQGFSVEFDDIDLTAVHFLLFDDEETPIATCRVFFHEERNTYVLGRLAVMKDRRGNNIGRRIVEEAEAYVGQMGGRELQLHAQCRITAFYERLGYVPFGDVEDEEGCPHIWMRKMIKP